MRLAARATTSSPSSRRRPTSTRRARSSSRARALRRQRRPARAVPRARRRRRHLRRLAPGRQRDAAHVRPRRGRRLRRRPRARPRADARLRRALRHDQSRSRSRPRSSSSGSASARPGCRWSRRPTSNAPCCAPPLERERPAGRRVSDVVRIIPLGGLGEIGKNMRVVEQGERRILIDCGLAFPRDEMLGVDLVLPDFAYLREAPAGSTRSSSRTATRTTSAPCRTCMREVGVPEVWGTRLTLGMVKSKLDEHGLIRDAELLEIDPDGDPVAVRAVRGRVRARHALHPRRRRRRAAHAPGHDRAHRRLQDRPHADRRPPAPTSPARAPRRRRRRPHARRLHERRAPGHHAVRAARRRGAQAHRPRRAGPRHRDVLRVAHPPAAGGHRRLRGRAAAGSASSAAR